MFWFRLSQPKIGFPYRRQNGVKGEWETFNDSEEYLNFIADAKKSAYLWTDYEELHAVANLYQIKIKVITVKSNDDSNPRTNIIEPDPELESFSLLPPGKVPDMTLLHFDNAHFDLIVSKHSRLVKNVLPSNINEEASKESVDLKEKYEKLKIAYNESLMKIKKLETKHTSEKKKDERMELDENDDVVNDDAIDESKNEENDEERILLASKQSGFLRDNPQHQPRTKPSLKTIECEFCDKRFGSNIQLKNHMQNHGNEGDWTCDDCHYQTNEKSNLSKHVYITKHSSQQLKQKQENKLECNFCDETFITVEDQSKHRRTHRTFKECKNLPNCQYANECIFYHEKIENNKLICYECGETTR